MLLAKRKNQINNLQKDKKHIIIGDKYYSSNITSIQNYYKKTKEYYSFKKQQKNDIIKKNINISENNLNRCLFIGFDDDHNSYWRGKDTSKKWEEFVLVYSRYGNILDAFYIEDLKDKSLIMGKSIKIAITHSGDVYFMRNDETGSYFWKVERRW